MDDVPYGAIGAFPAFVAEAGAVVACAFSVAVAWAGALFAEFSCVVCFADAVAFYADSLFAAVVYAEFFAAGFACVA